MKNDEAYENARFIPGGADFPAKWLNLSTAWRRALGADFRAKLDRSYGPSPRQAFDLFLPKDTPRGVLVFVHGGYWRRFNRDDFSHLAAGAVARGYAVAMVGYDLAPSVTISAITKQVARALGPIAKAVPEGKIYLAGHSAGGHLVARMRCRDVALPKGVEARLAGILSISPLGDLRPLLETLINEDLGLTAAEAASESPALCQDLRDIPTHILVGGDERPVFIEQAQQLSGAWPGTTLTIAPGYHHFDIIEDLGDPEADMLTRLFGYEPGDEIEAPGATELVDDL